MFPGTNLPGSYLSLILIMMRGIRIRGTYILYDRKNYHIIIRIPSRERINSWHYHNLYTIWYIFNTYNIKIIKQERKRENFCLIMFILKYIKKTLQAEYVYTYGNYIHIYNSHIEKRNQFKCYKIQLIYKI